MTNPTEGGSFGRVRNVFRAGAAVALLSLGNGLPASGAPQEGEQLHGARTQYLRTKRMPDQLRGSVALTGDEGIGLRHDAILRELDESNEALSETLYALEVGAMALLGDDETVTGRFDRVRGPVVFSMRRGELPQGPVWFAYRLNGNQSDLLAIHSIRDRRLVGFRNFDGSETFTLEAINDATGSIDIAILSGRWYNADGDYDVITFPTESGSELTDGRNYTTFFDGDGRIYTTQVLNGSLNVQSRDISPGSQRRLRTYREDVSREEVPVNEQICGMTVTSDGGVWVVLNDRITRVQRGNESSQQIQLAGGSRVLVPRLGRVDDTVRVLNASGLIESYVFKDGTWTKADDIIVKPPRIEQDGSVAVPALWVGDGGTTYVAYSTAESNVRANANRPFVYVVSLTESSVGTGGTESFANSGSAGLQGEENQGGYASLMLPPGAYPPGQSAGFDDGSVSVSSAGISAFGNNLAGPGRTQLFYTALRTESIRPASNGVYSGKVYLPVANANNN